MQQSTHCVEQRRSGSYSAHSGHLYISSRSVPLKLVNTYQDSRRLGFPIKTVVRGRPNNKKDCISTIKLSQNACHTCYTIQHSALYYNDSYTCPTELLAGLPDVRCYCAPGTRGDQLGTPECQQLEPLSEECLERPVQSDFNHLKNEDSDG